MKLKHFFYVFAALLFTASCEYKMIEELEPEIPADGVSFSTDITPIINDNCVTCHGNSGGLTLTGDPYSALKNGSADDGTPYIDTENVDNSYLLITLADNIHNGKLTSQEIGLIKAWIEAGAENN